MEWELGIKTKIEWCDSTINPIMGCTGCALRKDHCYAATLCGRYAGCKGWPKSFDHPEFFPGRLEKAIRWKDLTGTKRPNKPWLDGYPRVVFVNDLSDGFCPGVDPGEWLSPLLDQMEVSPHIWLLLTKWPGRMASYFGQSWLRLPDNFWFGTSITNQKDADECVPLLLQILAAVHLLSMEPLLTEVDIAKWLSKSWKFGDWWSRGHTMNSINGVFAGGETGHGARPMHPQWARDIRDQCAAAGVPYFHKHNGEWAPYVDHDVRATQWHWFDPDQSGRPDMHRIGKKQAGRLLDGKEHNEMPDVTIPRNL